MCKSGVYQILNRINGKRYIGSAVDMARRWREHRSGLRRGTHCNAHLQNAWSLYGGQAFAFAVLEYVIDLERLIEREQHYMGVLCPEYNVAPIAGSQLGIKHTEATRLKVSNGLTGRVLSEEHRRNISETQKGSVFSEERRRHISEALKTKVELSVQDVLGIKALLRESMLSEREIAARYGVKRQTVSDIKIGRRWVRVGG